MNVRLIPMPPRDFIPDYCWPVSQYRILKEGGVNHICTMTHGDLLLHLLLEAPPHVALLHQVVFVATGVLHSLLDHHFVCLSAKTRWLRRGVSRGYRSNLDGAVGDDPHEL